MIKISLLCICTKRSKLLKPVIKTKNEFYLPQHAHILQFALWNVQFQNTLATRAKKTG
jgi:hypothetical protein